MKRPLIAHILPWPNVGGTEHATLRVAAAASTDFDSVFYCRQEAEAVRQFCLSAGVQTVPYQAVEPSFSRPVPYLQAAYRLSRDLRQRGVALMHCSDVLAAHYCALAGRLAGIPVISHVRNRLDTITHRDRTFLHPVNHFVFVSRDTWSRFGYSVAPSRGSVLYDGFDLHREDAETCASIRQSLNIPPTAPLIGMAARVSPQKDYQTLIRAAATVVAAVPETRFLVIGDYDSIPEHREHYAKVRQWLRESSMEPHFVFAGFQTEVPRILSAIDIFVLSTHWEGLPLVILEAMACARPVAATNVDGVPEIVRHRQTGLLHNAGDSDGLACNLLELLRNPHYAAELAGAGQRIVETQFSVKRFGDDVRSLYRRWLPA